MVQETLSPEWDDRSEREIFSELDAPSARLPSKEEEGLERISGTLGRANVRLLSTAEDPSLRHLGVEASGAQFSFTPAHLQRLVDCNAFGPGLAEWGGNLVLFALRGCRLADDPDHIPPTNDLLPSLGLPSEADRMPDKLPLWGSTGGFVTSATLVEDQITHVLPRCLIGVWDRAAGQFALVRGTTVPNWEYSSLAIDARKGKPLERGDANLCLPGLYRYEVDHHKNVPDAFRLQDGTQGTVRPSPEGKTEISYTTRDSFWWSGSQDNMHPSSAAWGSAKEYIFHYSAGCSTIQGRFDREKQRHEGAWSVYRTWAGLAAHAVDHTAIGRKFSYVLLTGREARLAAGGAADQALTRVRYGSRGETVQKLQKALGLAESGRFDSATQRSFVTWQWKKGANPGSADGVLTHNEAGMLGVTS